MYQETKILYSRNQKSMTKIIKITKLRNPNIAYAQST